MSTLSEPLLPPPAPFSIKYRSKETKWLSYSVSRDEGSDTTYIHFYDSEFTTIPCNPVINVFSGSEEAEERLRVLKQFDATRRVDIRCSFLSATLCLFGSDKELFKSMVDEMENWTVHGDVLLVQESDE
jgi:hypothetical protein